MTGKSQSIPSFCRRTGDADCKTILIVEDEMLVAWDIEQTLRDHNFKDFKLATSCKGAREHIERASGQVSLIILDLKLEDGNASALIDEFTAHNIPVLVVTGYIGFAHAQIPIVYKPFSTITLLEAVYSLLVRRC